MAKKNRRSMSCVQRRDSGQGEVVARWGSASVEGDAPVLQLSLATVDTRQTQQDEADLRDGGIGQHHPDTKA